MGKYDSHLFRVSSLGLITAGLTSYDELYSAVVKAKAEQSEKVDKYRTEYNAMNKQTKTAEKKLKTLNNASEKLDTLQLKENEYKSKLGKVAISEGCKTHLTDLDTCFRFERSQDIKNKYIEKGLEQEGSSIDLINFIKGTALTKNKERKDDGYITGEIDLLHNYIIDAKSSWNAHTFRRNIKYVTEPRQCPYYESAQGYMKLWDKDLAKIDYCLVDTPKRLIEAEKKKLLFDFIGNEEDYEAACDELEKMLTFADIPMNKRLIEVVIPRDEEFISLIQPTVIACREFMNEFKDIYYEMD